MFLDPDLNIDVKGQNPGVTFSYSAYFSPNMSLRSGSSKSVTAITMYVVAPIAKKRWLIVITGVIKNIQKNPHMIGCLQ